MGLVIDFAGTAIFICVNKTEINAYMYIIKPLYNTLNNSKTVSLAIPLPDNTIPGASYKVAIYRGGDWEELDGRIDEQAVYAEITGDLGPMILIQKPSNAVYYYDNSVYSNQQVTRIEIDLMIKESAVTANPPGTFTLSYTDYSVSPSGTNDSIIINFERLADSTLVAGSINTLYGRVVVNSASINISSPDNVTYSLSDLYDLELGQSLLISNDKTISEMKGNNNIPDKLVFSYGGNNLAFEYTSLNGEGQIRRGSGGSYYYNYYLKDHLGSTRMVINDAGDITDAIMYQPYGKMEEVAGIATPGADPERERFTGKEFDREGNNNGANGIELFYFSARYYDAEVGYWISADRMRQFWNPYAYMGNGINPIIGIDPDGNYVIYAVKSANTGEVVGYRVKFESFTDKVFEFGRGFIPGPMGVAVAATELVLETQKLNNSNYTQRAISLGLSFTGLNSLQKNWDNGAKLVQGLTTFNWNLASTALGGWDSAELINSFRNLFGYEHFANFSTPEAATIAVENVLAPGKISVGEPTCISGCGGEGW